MASNLSDEKEADTVITEILDKLKPEIESKLSMKFTVFRPISYKTQTVRGTNFFIKIKISGIASDKSTTVNKPPAASNNQPIKFVHVRVWRDLPVNSFKLTLYPFIQLNKLESDPIDYFE